MNEHWHITQLFEILSASFINHLFRTGRSRTLHFQIRSSFSCSKNSQELCTSNVRKWVLLDGWSDIQKEVLSLFKSTDCTTNVLYVLLAIRLTASEGPNNIGIFQVQMIGLCKRLSGASVVLTSAITVQLIVNKKSHAARNSTLLRYVYWSIVSRPRRSANKSIIAIVLHRSFIACKATNKSILIVPMNT